MKGQSTGQLKGDKRSPPEGKLMEKKFYVTVSPEKRPVGSWEGVTEAD